jgi:DNA-directed RNA polymerase subunit RPC12/RpoP
MKSEPIKLFTSSAGALLLFLATTLFIGNATNASLISPRDPLLMISIRNTFWIIGVLELGVALVCFFGKRDGLKAALVLWLVLNLCVYQIGLAWSAGGRAPIGFLGNLANAFGMSLSATYLLLKTGFLYLLAGSAASLFWNWVLERRRWANPSLKMSCAQCGGHVEFFLRNLGQKVPCPHCQTAITLRKPDNLKMSCFFCQEHIEYPAHAIGEKLKCPHCHKDITLKETATV